MRQQRPTAPDTAHGTSHSGTNPPKSDARELACFIEGQGQQSIFMIRSATNEQTDNISDIKDAIFEKGFTNVGFLAKDLILFKVDIDPREHTEDSLKKLEYKEGDPAFKMLYPLETVSSYWPSRPDSTKINVFVKPPAPGDSDGSREAKRQKLDQPAEDELPHAKKRGGSDRHTSDRSTHDQIKDTMLKAFKPFTQYIEYLAAGKLDAYLDSYERADKPELSGLHQFREPMLLLHRLGKDSDEAHKSQGHNLFSPQPFHLFAVAGSGKTRLALDGLCDNWGLYIPCLPPDDPGPGPQDFNAIVQTLPTIKNWEIGTGDVRQIHRAGAADRVFTMMVYSRVYILYQLIQHIPESASALDARRRWVLAQVLPPILESVNCDLLVVLFEALRHADTLTLHRMICTMLADLTSLRPDFFPEGDNTRLSVVIDEAQVAADTLTDAFINERKANRPILKEMYHFFLQRVRLFAGIILPGTSLTRRIVDDPWGGSAAPLQRPESQTITHVGRYTRGDPDQKNYILQYLSLSTCVEDTELMERMEYWLSGRYCLTANFIELLLRSKSHSRHRMLTAFVKHLTGFEITDAIALEETELPLDEKSLEWIQSYRKLLAPEHLFWHENRMLPVEWLVEVLMRWTVGSESTTIPLHGDVQGMIACGIGFLDEPGIVKPTKAMVGEGNSVHVPKPEDSYYHDFYRSSVHIFEPLVVLALSSLFEKQDYTKRYNGLQKSFSEAPTQAARGYLFENAVLFMLIDKFGEKPTALGEVFQLDGDLAELASRKVTLVALKRCHSGNLSCSPVTWNSGCSDRFGTKAHCPNDVLDFLKNPNGKIFLFPDNNMGPDLLCFLRDEETGELIILVGQVKLRLGLTPLQWNTTALTTEPDWYHTQSLGTAKAKQYSPVKYPKLLDDLKQVFEELGGGNQILGLEATPRFLKVMYVPDSQLGLSEIGVLKWKVMFRYLGQNASGLRSHI